MRRWKPRSTQIEKLQGPFPDLIARVLASRGLTQENLDCLLSPKLSELKDPMSMAGMKSAVDRIVSAYRQDEMICIYADFDLDGTSGLAILKTGLEKIGFKKVAFYQPKRLSEGYGFHAEAVDELKNLGVSLIVTVDVGITSFKAFERAQELGVDVILTDHHLPADELPKAFCIVNPNLKECSSGLNYLCGAGVAFYLLRAVKRAFFDAADLPKNEWDLKEVLEFFSIGTLTDMVPLIEDNRILVKHGLKVLSTTTKPGLRALLDALNLDGRELTSQDVAIRFAPKLNALSRMETNILPAQIYLETNLTKAKETVKTVLENNEVRQSLQIEAETRANSILENWQEKDFVFVSSPLFHRGIIGLIATKISQQFNRPAFVGSENSEGMIVGSARVPNGSDISLVDALRYCEEVLNRFGGHAAAAGFELHQKNQDLFKTKLAEYFMSLEKQENVVEIDFDTDADLAEINPNVMKWYDFIGPFGVGFNIPILRFEKIALKSKKELRGGHLKLNFTDGNNQNSVDGLIFSPPEKMVSMLDVGKRYNVLSELQWNYFNGRKSIQLLIKDLKTV
jgi:single-stranded-DNA-specific exonuclease